MGMVVGGLNPVAVETVCARLMGFDHRRLPILSHAFVDEAELPLVRFEADEIECHSNAPEFDRLLRELGPPAVPFRAHFGWQGHIELNGRIPVAR